MAFGFIITALLRSFFCLITRSYQPVTKFWVGGILVASLNVMVFVPRFGLPGAIGEAIGLGAMGMIVFVTILIEFNKPGSNRELHIIFNCPYCEQSVSFEQNLENAAEPCPDCGEIVTVTTDESVHAQEKEAYLALLKEAAAADPDSVDLDGAEEVKVGSYRDPILEGRM